MAGNRLTVDASCASSNDSETGTPCSIGTIVTRNTAQKDGDCWVWELTVSSLDVVLETVTMRLHPTFKPDVVVMTKLPDRVFSSGELRGWGTFPVVLHVATCGQLHSIEHMLCFDQPETVIHHDLSTSALYSRERRSSAERASSTWRPHRTLPRGEAKRQRIFLQELRQAQRDLERSQRGGKSSDNLSGPSSTAAVRSASAREHGSQATGRARVPPLSMEQKKQVTLMAQALRESISELAEAGDAAGVAKACALLHEDCIEAFSELEGEDDGIREFAENAIQEYANFLTSAKPSPDKLRELGERAIKRFLQRTFSG